MPYYPPPYTPVTAKATYTTTFSTTSTTYVDITGLSVSVTLTKTSNVLVYGEFYNVYNTTYDTGLYTAITRGTSVLKAVYKLTIIDAGGYLNYSPHVIIYLDKDVPAGSYTYKLQGKVIGDTGNWVMGSAELAGEICVVVF
jgi:hypothetical protein